jgi:penicillin-binding protein 1C
LPQSGSKKHGHSCPGDASRLTRNGDTSPSNSTLIRTIPQRRSRLTLPQARWFRALLSTALALVGFALAAWAGLHFVPLPRALFEPPPATREFTDRNGAPLRIVPLGEQGLAKPVRFSQIPQPLVQATLAAEDRRFWRHLGVDWRASLRAAADLVRHRRVISGGSTITQQLIKLAQPRPRTFRTKVIEAVQALRLEQVWDKQRILTEYLNRIDYGNFNTGCAAAASYYLGKPLDGLSAAECALLAGLPQAPGRLNPAKHFDRAHKRQQWILGRMRAAGWLTDAECELALAESARLKFVARPFQAPHFVDLLLNEAAGTDFLPGSPAPVRTTLDLELNRVAETVVRRQVARLAAQHVGNGAVVILDNRSGGVRALVGSEDYFAPQSGQVNGAWAPRSAGSTFKPFTYAIAFEQGATPASVVADVSAEFATATGLFAPVNYDHRCHGPMRYRLALANSLNISAVKVLASVGGPELLQKRLQACGLTTLTQTPEHYGLGLTIGNAEARLLELANAFACLARLGEYRTWAAVEEAAARPDAQGSRRVFDPTACFLIADILSDNGARAQSFGVDSQLRFDFPVACKTGTSSDFRDNWAFGYTPEFTVGVWVGNFDGTPMQGISGVTGAAPILHELMEHLHARFGTTWYAQPPTVTEAVVHSLTGKQATAGRAPDGLDWVAEKFSVNHPPPIAGADEFDARGRVRLGAEYRAWLGSSDNWLGDRVALDEVGGPLRIVSPVPGTVYYLDADLPREGGRIRLKREGPGAAHWHSDTLECRREADGDFAWLTVGRHRIEARDPQTGERRETWIEVVRR